MPRDRKSIPDSELSGQEGINLVEEVALGMGFLWHPPGAFDAGIDGRIELRDARTGEPLNRFIGVQSKGWAKFTAETDDGFEFLCEEAHVRYWMQSVEPVLLVCSHPETREAWFVCVTDWFSDAERRAARRVVFDKPTDVFDAARAPELLRLAFRSEPALHRRPAAPAEKLVTNMLPIVEHGRRVWSAPTNCWDHRDVHRLYDEVGGSRASDYLLRDGLLYSLRDPRTCPLQHICDTENVESVDADDWALSDEPRLRRYWVELLRRTLLQQVKRQLRWHPDRGVFFYPAPDPLDEVHIEGAHGRRQVVKVDYYIDRRTNASKVKYVRHHAFRPGFSCVDGCWHLEVEPDYVFTYDGERRNFRGDEYLANIKKLEKNLAVVGHLRMWEYVLTRPPSLLSAEPPLLGFGPLVCVDVEPGIDDQLWRGRENPSGGAPPGQEELAA